MAWTFNSVAISALTLCVAAVQPAFAQSDLTAGELTCEVKGGIGFVVGSTKEIRCLFRASPGDPGERYEGKIEKFGLDVGVTDNAVLAWTVLAPTSRLEPGSLRGRYYGVAADASVGAGGGANVLVGGSRDTISLQPLSVQGQTGLNAAVAVAALELFPFDGGK